MITEEQRAPGCFGAASVFSMDSTVCQACVAFKSCGDASVKTLESIREMVDVRDILARHTAARARARAQNRLDSTKLPVQVVVTPLIPRQPDPVVRPVERVTTKERVTFDISDDDQSIIAIIGEKSVKAREQAIVLCKQNKIAQARADLPKGINPFAVTGPSFLRVACDLLINGGFTKATLKMALITELKWTDNTAGSHVAMTCALLYMFRIMTVSQGKADQFVLNPNIC